MSWLTAAGIGGAGMSSALSFFGQREANESNERIAQENRKFQERMSSSAHQRQRLDLRKAGLNPMLGAMGGSGASSPAGATATMQSELGEAGKIGAAAASSALDLKRQQKEIKALDQTTKKALADTTLAESSNQIALSTAKSAAANATIRQAEVEPALVHAKIDATMAPVDAGIRRARDASGIFSGLVPDILFGRKTKSTKTRTSKERFDARGEHRGTVHTTTKKTSTKSRKRRRKKR